MFVRFAMVLLFWQSAVCSSAAPLGGAEPLPPPFGLRWGDPPGRLVDWAVRTGLDQIVKSPAREPQLKVLMIGPPTGTLPGHEASMLEARFLDGRLFEVTLHYNYTGKPVGFVRGQFTELKSILTRRHGSFKPAGKRKEIAREGIVTRSTAYRVDPGKDRQLLLALTEVTDAARGDSAAKFSVMYHNASVLGEKPDPIVIRRDGVDLPDGR